MRMIEKLVKVSAWRISRLIRINRFQLVIGNIARDYVEN